MRTEVPSTKPVQVDEDTTDPSYHETFVDTDELRSDPVPHRYVNGGFVGTGARFSFYFPPAETYQGRFFHNTYPLALSEDVGPFPIAFDVAVGDIAFTVDSGAYYVQTNLGGIDRLPPADPSIAAYRVNAAAAKHSRVVAAEIYGPHRPYGYLYGGSGGSYQVMGAAQNTRGVWDGFLPYVLGSPNAIPSVFTVRMHALRVLRRRGKLPGIADALDAGGCGDPYAELDDEERAALREATLMGYPLRGWWDHPHLDSGYFYNVADLVPELDPTYVDDFWTKSGYLGGDPTSSIHAARRRARTTVAAVVPGFPMQLELSAVPEWDITNAHVALTSGRASGRSFAIASVDGTRVAFALAVAADVLMTIQPGDEVLLDNAWPLALETYQRHQVPDTVMYGWNQYREPDATPVYPQREVLVGPIAAGGAAGCDIDGNVSGKVLVLESLMDIDALAWQADWYRTVVKRALGPDRADQIAVWFIDHAMHDDPKTPEGRAHTISYGGALQQGLRDLAAWVERGVRPPETVYKVVESQVVVPAGAAERAGIQPVVVLTADGSARTEVVAGAPVRFSASIEVPPGAGDVVAAEWDFEGDGGLPTRADFGEPRARVELNAEHTYGSPGTRFAVLRATSQRDGDAATPYGRVQNLARVRIVVREAS